MIVLRNKNFSFLSRLKGNLSWGRFIKSIGANFSSAWEKTKNQIDNIRALGKNRNNTTRGINIFRKACENRFKNMEKVR